MQTWSWNRRSGKSEIDIQTIINLVLMSCGHLADAFFIVSFAATFYWFIFFKKQAYVHVLLPMKEQERIIRDLMIAAFALKVCLLSSIRFPVYMIIIETCVPINMTHRLWT